MNIIHKPIFDTDKIIKHYEEKDGVPIHYICTSAINMGTLAADIFYRETPHPEFGNRYFGLYNNSYFGNSTIMITNADPIETLDFTMVDINDKLYYSQHRHDFHTIGDVSIDGGRAYIRLVGNLNYPTVTLKVKNGEFVNAS